MNKTAGYFVDDEDNRPELETEGRTRRRLNPFALARLRRSQLHMGIVGRARGTVIVCKQGPTVHAGGPTLPPAA